MITRILDSYPNIRLNTVKDKYFWNQGLTNLSLSNKHDKGCENRFNYQNSNDYLWNEKLIE